MLPSSVNPVLASFPQLDRENLVHFFDNVDLPSDPIIKFWVMWTPDRVDSLDGKVFL